MCLGPSGRVEMLVADDSVTLKQQSVHCKLNPASSQNAEVTAVQESPGPSSVKTRDQVSIALFFCHSSGEENGHV